MSPDRDAKTLASTWLEGVTCFNQAAYWDAHEAWEAIWLPATGEHKHFYGGLILLAAALHKARNMKNPRGGRRNYAKALAHLAMLDEGFHGVNVRQLEAEVHTALCDGHSCPQLPTTS
jgi:predicted metal-dependent hydrolase